MNVDQEKTGPLFYVVEFPDDVTNQDDGSHSCASGVISSTWVVVEGEGAQKEVFCWWPNAKTDIAREKATITHKELSGLNATLWKINVKYQTDDFLTAKNKLKRLEETSDIETEEDCTGKKKRHIKSNKSKYDLESSESSEGDVKAPPKIPHPKPSVKNCKIVVLPNTGNNNEGGTNFQTVPVDINIVDFNNADFSTCTCCQSCVAFKNSLLKSYSKHEQTMDDLNNKMTYAVGVLQKVYIGPGELESVTLPISTVDELETVNTLLGNQEEFKKYFSVLKLIGGKDCGETARRTLTKLLSHDLALQINWSGRNNKPAFSQFVNVIRLLNDAVKANPVLVETYNEKEVMQSAKTWLRNAYDRAGGRSERKKNNNNM